MRRLEDDPDLRERIIDGALRLPIYVWSWRLRPARRYLGPTAQDFQHAFGTGGRGRDIDMRDALGVLLITVQAAHHRIADLEMELDRLRSRTDDGDVGGR
jgi:hypothetical protein